MPSTPSPQAR
jgi:hypothetical protein